jgi:SMODS-associated and fused to various effectors sensor domain/HNH endonuclease
MTRQSSRTALKRRATPAASGATDEPREVTRHIKPNVERMLWGVAAGRCEFEGCNQRLWQSSVTREQVNIAEKAHIYAFSGRGPRGHSGVTKEELNDLRNLLLVCPVCHKKIDQRQDGGRYTVANLRQMKERHERRIDIVTGITLGKQSHVVLYGANIGAHSSPLNYADAAYALFPDRYPADENAIELGMVNSALQERDDAFWEVESENLVRLVNQRIRERLTKGDIEHLSILALAPQPLLILFGSLLTDIPDADVYQRHREPPSWCWPEAATAPAFEWHEPPGRNGVPALVLSVSATVTSDRITSVLGDGASIWMVTVPAPHNDVVKSRSQLGEFRTLMRTMLDRIKTRHGQQTPLHIFPAAPVSIGIELGRVRMPKADMPWIIYDQVNERGGFVRALTLPIGVSQ